MSTSTQKSAAPTEVASPPPVRTFATVFAVIAAYSALLFAVVSHDASAGVADPKALISPIVVLVALTLVVLLMTALVRNAAVFFGKASIRYYREYGTGAPPEWIERPAKTYMNLLEVPLLFYVVAILMIVTGRVDAAQIHLAWLFVAMRVAHAGIYLAVNHVPSRFAAFTLGVITLVVLWMRFAMMM